MHRTSAEQATRNVPQGVDPAEKPNPPWQVAKFLHRLETAGRRITDEINADPREVAWLRKSRQQAKEGKVRWEEMPPDDTE